ncbi:cellulose biosynthesis protein BcsF [Lonsdalea quercina]|uniref:cellulose biosynthesis protein BcsF n=1 Tax=Lonsdalea quercina TaxID=71657 RepID=UPI00397684EA
MNLMEIMHAGILFLLTILVLRTLFPRWLSARWRGFIYRLTPSRAMKYVGTWRRKSSQSDVK